MRLATASMLLLSLVSASPAVAFDLTGHWEGAWSCTGINGGLNSKFSSKESAMAITSLGNGTFGAILDGSKWRGIELPAANNPNKGEIALINCSADNDLSGVAGFTELARFKVSTSGSNGSISGTSIYSEGPTDVFTCKYKLKRVDTVNPALDYSCP